MSMSTSRSSDQWTFSLYSYCTYEEGGPIPTPWGWNVP